MRPIDADAEIARLQKDYCEECSRKGNYGIFGAACVPCWVKDATEEFENAPTIEAEPVRQWIPCSERLPKQNCEVLVCCYGSDLIVTKDGETIAEAVERTRREFVRVTVGFIGSDGWYGADWFPMMVTPTYWMPLPEPPEGGADGA